ncbi:hypothetical protein HBH43_224070 [Parastagonospora nodorum]|nr:hypothetical protein HBH43_224070 [Parastagonospora nodorum]
MDRFCTICGFQPKTYAELAKYTARCYSRHLAQQSLELNEYNTAQDRKVHIYAADGLSSTIIVYDYIEKDKNADLAIANSISDAPDMCAKDDLEVLFQTHNRRLAEEPATAESITAKDSNHVDTFSLDFAFSFAEDIAKTSGLSGLKADQHFFVYQNILSLIAFIISHRPFADELVYALSQFFLGNTDYPVRNIQQSLPDRATVVLIIISRSTPSTLLAKFIPTTKIRNPLLKTLENAAKSGILLACADERIRQCYSTICAILANYEEQVLLTSVKKNRHCMQQFTQLQQERYLDKGHDDFHYNFNIHVSLATDTLHLLLKGLVMKMLDFMQDITEQKAIIQQLIAVVSPLFVLKAPFALHFIRAVCDLVTLAQYKSYDENTLAYIQGALERINVFKEEFRHALTHIIQDIRMYGALNSICTGANSKAHYITIVKQFYSMTNKKEYILQICLHNSQRTALLAANHATVVKQSQLSTTVNIQDRTYSTRVTRPLPFRRLRYKVAANIAISDFTHAAAVFQSSSKRYNDPEHCDEEIIRCVQEFEHRDNRRQSRTVTDGRVVAQLYLILIIIDHTCYDKDRKHIAYIRAFSKVLLFNNNRQIDNTTGMLSTLQAFKFYDLSTIIRLVHLVSRDLPNLTTHTTMSYYVNNYINWDEYNCLYSLTFNINLLRTLREY